MWAPPTSHRSLIVGHDWEYFCGLSNCESCMLSFQAQKSKFESKVAGGQSKDSLSL